MGDDTQSDLLREEMDRQGMLDNELRAGTAAICGGESGLVPQSERGYGSTSNTRIRRIFGSRLSHLSDAELTVLKRDDAEFFETVYGHHNRVGRILGNTAPGDGYKYIGRGIIQITGKGNYQRYTDLTGYDIVNTPERANDPRVAAAIAVAYMLDRYKGGGWTAMKAVVGNSFGAPDREKNRLFAKYVDSGEFDYVPSDDDEDPLDRSAQRLEELEEILGNFWDAMKDYQQRWS